MTTKAEKLNEMCEMTNKENEKGSKQKGFNDELSAQLSSKKKEAYKLLPKETIKIFYAVTMGRERASTNEWKEIYKTFHEKFKNYKLKLSTFKAYLNFTKNNFKNKNEIMIEEVANKINTIEVQEENDINLFKTKFDLNNIKNEPQINTQTKYKNLKTPKIYKLRNNKIEEKFNETYKIVKNTETNRRKKPLKFQNQS